MVVEKENPIIGQSIGARDEMAPGDATLYSATDTQSPNKVDNINLLINPSSQVLEQETRNKAKSEADIVLDDFCEIVVTFRCKFCPYMAEDKASMKFHIFKLHSTIAKTASSKFYQNDTSVQDKLVDTDDFEKSSKHKILEQVKAPTKDSINESPLTGVDDLASRSTDEEVRQEVFFCSECSIIFSSAKLCCDHMAQVHNLTEFSTELIRENPLNSQVEYKRKRIRHTKQESSPAKVAKLSARKSSEHMCYLCKTKFNTRNALENHSKCHIVNDLADQDNLPDTNTTNQKKRSSGYTKGYLCCYCDSDKDKDKFLTWSQCAMHLWKEHQVDCDLYSCTACQYKTPTLAKLKDHERLHSSEANFKCATCRKTFKQFKQLKTHEKYHIVNTTQLPPPADVRWYTPKECPICHRILSDSKCLKKHISAVHNKIKPFSCNICPHTCARKAELDLHVRQHTGEKPFKCPSCPFSTGDHNSLRKHKLRHGGFRPYKCPHCDYSVIQSSAYKKHVLVAHPGAEVVFVCKFCPLVSVNEKSFEAHCKDHQEGRIPSTVDDSSKLVKSNHDTFNDSVQVASDSSDSNSNNGQSSSKFWMRDEDSVEIIDTGGITIPESNNVVSNKPTNCLHTVTVTAGPSSEVGFEDQNKVREEVHPQTSANSFLSLDQSIPTFTLVDNSQEPQKKHKAQQGNNSKAKKTGPSTSSTKSKKAKAPTTTKKPKGKKGKVKETNKKNSEVEQIGEFHAISKEKVVVVVSSPPIPIPTPSPMAIQSVQDKSNKTNTTGNKKNKKPTPKKTKAKAKTKKSSTANTTANNKNNKKVEKVSPQNINENALAEPATNNPLIECQNSNSSSNINVNSRSKSNNNFGMDESRAISIVAELLDTDTDSTSLSQFLDPIMGGALADMSMFNDHSNDIFI